MTYIRSLLAALAIMPAAIFGADLTVQYVEAQRAWIDWDGINDEDGDGTATFINLGDTISSSLKVLCNKTAGYKITFTSANATGAAAANLVNGGNTLGYTAAMSLAGVTNATITTNSLNLTGSTHSVNVNFTGGTLPLNSGIANTIQLNLTLSNPGGILNAGTYQDVITATVTLN
jgi:hypothetical protein